MRFDKPKTKAMAAFLKKEADRVVGLSIEPDGVFIYTNSNEWCDDAGSGTFRGDSETAAIRAFYERVREAEPEPRVFDNDIDAILYLEDAPSSSEDVIAAFQRLIDSGVVWSLQGSYGRAAAALIDAGYCEPKEL